MSTLEMITFWFLKEMMPLFIMAGLIFTLFVLCVMYLVFEYAKEKILKRKNP